MSTLPCSICYCISLEKWNSVGARKVCDELSKFQETECPNREGTQKNYIKALQEIEGIVIQNIDKLEEMDCSPLQSRKKKKKFFIFAVKQTFYNLYMNTVSSMKESEPERRTFTIWWLNDKQLSSKKHQICGEDIEFQGGRKVQEYSNDTHTIEYHCSTPKKGSAPWSRSIVKLQGSPLWIINYRPRRVRASDTNKPRGSINKIRTSRGKNLSSSSSNVIVKKTPHFSSGIHFPVVRCASENNVMINYTNNNSPWISSSSQQFPIQTTTQNTKFKIEPASCTSLPSSPLCSPIQTDSCSNIQQNSSNFHQQTNTLFNQQNSNDFLIDITKELGCFSIPPTRQPPLVHRMVERTFSDPNRCQSFNQQHYSYWNQNQNNYMNYTHNDPTNNPCILSHEELMSNHNLTENERTIIYFVEKLLNSRNDLTRVAKEASKFLNLQEIQQFNYIVRLIMGTPLRNNCDTLSRQSRFLLSVISCIDSK